MLFERGFTLNSLKFGILGGDFRYKYFYDMLINDGFNVKIFNNSFVDNNEDTLDDMLKDTDVLITPIPFSKNDKTIFNPNFEEISFEVLISKLKKSNIKIIAGGVIPKNFIKMCNLNNINVFDFFEQESVAVLNAIPTAEGAIQTAMMESDKTIFGSNSLVLGYGRCGKILANTLKGIGSNVTATYRKEQDYSYINAFGLKPIHLSEIKTYINSFDFIFNTIPHCILDKEILKKINRNTIIIDLAQAPGGVDYNSARALNINAIYCPSLPGRVAPYTASEILKNALLNYCFEKNKA